jgi:hypothetical protein
LLDVDDGVFVLSSRVLCMALWRGSGGVDGRALAAGLLALATSGASPLKSEEMRSSTTYIVLRPTALCCGSPLIVALDSQQ